MTKLTYLQLKEIERVLWAMQPMGTLTLDDLQYTLNDLDENGKPSVPPSDPDAWRLTRGILKPYAKAEESREGS